MSQRAIDTNTTPAGGLAARVLAVDGTWACLWIPATGETTWVDLAQVEHEPL